MSELDGLREQVNAEAIARASMDEDLGRIQAKQDMHTGLLTALRETQVRHGHQLTELNGRVDLLGGKIDRQGHVLTGIGEQNRALSERVDQQGQALTALRGSVDGIGDRTEHLITLVEQLIERGR